MSCLERLALALVGVTHDGPPPPTGAETLRALRTCIGCGERWIPRESENAIDTPCPRCALNKVTGRALQWKAERNSARAERDGARAEAEQLRAELQTARRDETHPKADAAVMRKMIFQRRWLIRDKKRREITVCTAAFPHPAILRYVSIWQGAGELEWIQIGAYRVWSRTTWCSESSVLDIAVQLEIAVRGSGLVIAELLRSEDARCPT